MCEVNGLQITNRFFEHMNIHKYIWTGNKKLRSIIDYNSETEICMEVKQNTTEEKITTEISKDIKFKTHL